MKPYYESRGITIYQGDSLEVLANLEASDAVITDPPYNAGKPYGQHYDSMPDDEYRTWLGRALEACSSATKDGVVFFPGTSNVFKIPALLKPPMRIHRLLGWHRKEFAGDKWTGGPAMSWEPVIWASKSEKPAFNRIYGSSGRDFLVVNSTKLNPYAKVHPCPKPFPVMLWLVGLFVPQEGLVLDPFMGTGTTLRAAKDLGRRAIGIELEERFCEIAADRLAQEVLSS